MAWTAARGDGAQDVDSRGQADVLRNRQRGLDGVIARMQNKAPAAVNRPAVPDDEVACLAGQTDRFLLVHDAELHQKVREQHLLRLIDDQAHRALVAVGADVDYRASETV